ncbi:MAG: response regulator [Planctomycetota bacterium]|nr:response regulator [Planctomycetota bacterium]
MNLCSGANLEILIIDDDPFVRESIQLFLESEEFRVRAASGGEQGLELLNQQEPDVALVDLRMPRMNGLEVLREIKKIAPEVEVVMATGEATLESALSAMKLGAYSYIEKPIVDLQTDLLEVLLRAAERRKLRQTNRDLQGELQLTLHRLEAERREHRATEVGFPLEQMLRKMASATGDQLQDLLFSTIPAGCPALLFVRKDQQLIPFSAKSTQLPSEQLSLPVGRFTDPAERWREADCPDLFPDQQAALVLPLFWLGQLEGLFVIEADQSRVAGMPPLAYLRCIADAAAALLGSIGTRSSFATG